MFSETIEPDNMHVTSKYDSFLILPNREKFGLTNSQRIFRKIDPPHMLE